MYGCFTGTTRTRKKRHNVKRANSVEPSTTYSKRVTSIKSHGDSRSETMKVKKLFAFNKSQKADKKKSQPAKDPKIPRIIDPDPKSPLNAIPHQAQKIFLSSSVTKEQAEEDYDAFLACLYMLSKRAWTRHPVLANRRKRHRKSQRESRTHLQLKLDRRDRRNSAPELHSPRGGNREKPRGISVADKPKTIKIITDTPSGDKSETDDTDSIVEAENAKEAINTTEPVKPLNLVPTSSGNIADDIPLRRQATRRVFSPKSLNALFREENPKDHYTAITKIGKGSYGSVFIGRVAKGKGKNRKKKERVAMKVINKDFHSNVESIASEIQLLKKCEHPNLVKFITSFLYKDKITLVMEYCDGGTLQDLIQVNMEESHAVYILKELITGIKYLHSIDTMHRDLKSENVLLNVNGDLKIADLGLATPTDPGKFSHTTLAGSRAWMAPEVIKVEGYNESADIWSLGCIGMELADGHPPHHSGTDSLQNLLLMVTKGPPEVRSTKICSPNYKQFLRKCFNMDKKKRLSAAALLKLSLFKTNVAKRNEMTELLKMAFVIRVTEGLDYF